MLLTLTDASCFGITVRATGDEGITTLTGFPFGDAEIGANPFTTMLYVPGVRFVGTLKTRFASSLPGAKLSGPKLMPGGISCGTAWTCKLFLKSIAWRTSF